MIEVDKLIDRAEAELMAGPTAIDVITGMVSDYLDEHAYSGGGDDAGMYSEDWGDTVSSLWQSCEQYSLSLAGVVRRGDKVEGAFECATIDGWHVVIVPDLELILEDAMEDGTREH